ncbi:redoxin family protein [Subsaxibacter sp. CAU 1640]|uniref:TlpA family protein disulfide reductase n=1 Tax=Subsaxibacter sp. CAU 1640 TaxID=2933271 RepID=UPI0020056EF7|nr:redoxin family protein [Subsaxibacter sp. CAU 1640]MCK7589173.1 redoxin family protein [Subsaxibacter sp. CAU 1640]
MKNISITSLAVILLVSCKEKETVDIHYISEKFYENVESIEKIQYYVQSKMTFTDGNVSENVGFAIIEREPNDTIFGFSFYGIKTNNNKSTIYKNGLGFLISNNENNFRQVKAEHSLLDRYGGPMVYRDLFKLDRIYKSVNITETENSFILNFVFEDDLKNKITNKTKQLELSKYTFLPRKIVYSSQPDFGSRNVAIYDFDNFKINQDVDKSISEFIQGLNQYELLKEEEATPNHLLNKKLPLISLKNLLDENETVEIETGKITLIDFWEVWCSPCIASFPKVENLKNTFSSDLNIVGIVSDNKENAIKLVKHKGTTFLNLIGNKELYKAFSLDNGLPRYFLIDSNGIIQKEYHGFSSQIEKDIRELIQK